MNTPVKPIFDPAFWRYRLLWAASHGRGTHTAIYDTSPDNWNAVQNASKQVLSRYLVPGDQVLDAGCGYGALSSYLPDNVGYVGVDLSPELIEVARMAYPSREFVQADLHCLPFSDRSFDWAVCRSIRQMVIDNLGEREWLPIERELLRVAKRLMVIEYEDVSNPLILPEGIYNETSL